jgi:FlaA1/EpsC-like NDP-sugar epimerase
MKRQTIDWLYGVYNSLSRPYKRRLLIALDGVLCLISIYSALSLRFNIFPANQKIEEYSWLILLLIILKLSVFYIKGMYRPILRYTDLEFLWTAAQSVLYSSGTLVILAYFQRDGGLPRSVLIIDAVLTLVSLVTVRALVRSLFAKISTFRSGDSLERFIIYGAGSAGSQLARALINDPNYRLIGFIDDDIDLQQQVIQGLKVYSPLDLTNLLQEKPFDTVLLAMPFLDKNRRREIIDSLKTLPIFVKTIPTLEELLSNKVSINEIRKIDVAELLGREEVLPNPELLNLNITGKSVLVTGAGGSIGSELCRQIAKLQPKCLIFFELNEYSLYKIDLEIAEHYPQIKRHTYLGNIAERDYFEGVLKKHKVETIYHAAAYKHVPLVEANPGPGVYNNVAGTLVAAQSAIAAKVSNFVLISTDKAVRPTNIMGTSKRIAELTIQGLADLPSTHTCFSIVRFGNVLDSSGSVVPRFRQQIALGKSITVTHPEVTRYFMSIPEAVRLVIQAGAMAQGGEVFLLDMGEPIRIYDLAVQMIRLSGLIPGEDIDIEFTGLRPGEKLYEELLINGDNIKATKHPKIYCAREHKIAWQVLHPMLRNLLNQAQTNDLETLIESLQDLVPEYQNQKITSVTKSSNRNFSDITDKKSLEMLKENSISG